MTCAQYQDELVAHAQRELKGLAAQRVNSHLAHCYNCRSIADSLNIAIATAKEEKYVVANSELTRLQQRLQPYVEAADRQKRHARWSLSAILVASAVAALAALVVWVHQTQPFMHDTTTLIATAPSPFVRVVSDVVTDGVTQGDQQHLIYNFTKGTVAFDFIGGQGRSLIVQTPLAHIRAVGTRFAVSLNDNESIIVAVGEGQVAIDNNTQHLLVSAGQQVLLDKTTINAKMQNISAQMYSYLNNSYLTNHHEVFANLQFATNADKSAGATMQVDGITTINKRKINKNMVAPAPARTAHVARSQGQNNFAKTIKKIRHETSDFLPRLTQAEQMQQAGSYLKALAIYDECLRVAGLERSITDLCRFERARIYGFALGQSERAREVFVRLAKTGVGEVQKQAMLALCELQRALEPCAAVACLSQLVTARNTDNNLRREAKRLAKLWDDAAQCSKALPQEQ
ncbi:MAG: FecR domain-containing protein [Deltaproteobacteria bacterium]|nr:FecR domain-containing protein [Deltaproteobacteria bacterium]